MEVRLLETGYKNNENLYRDFIEGNLEDKKEYFSDETFYINDAPNFPIYMGRGSEEKKKNDFLEAFRIVSTSYVNTDREVVMNERFWHTLLLTKKQDYILSKYPEVLESENKFRNIVLKKFDWENYIYKVILGAQYIQDTVKNPADHPRYYKLIVENLDLYNYIIKYEIFRNDTFLINILDIVDELNLSKLMKAKIKGREDLGDDERYGRRVIFEFNKSYPVVMSPMLGKEELKKYFIQYLSYYYSDANALVNEQMSKNEIATPDETYQESSDSVANPSETHVAEKAQSKKLRWVTELFK